MVFISERENAYLAIRTEFLNIIQVILFCQDFKELEVFGVLAAPYK